MEGPTQPPIVIKSSITRKELSVIQCTTLGELRREAERMCHEGVPVVCLGDEGKYSRISSAVPDDMLISALGANVKEIYLADSETQCEGDEVLGNAVKVFDCLQELEKSKQELPPLMYGILWGAIKRTASECIQEAQEKLQEVIQRNLKEATVVFPVLHSPEKIVIELSESKSMDEFKLAVETNIRIMQTLEETIAKEIENANNKDVEQERVEFVKAETVREQEKQKTEEVRREIMQQKMELEKLSRELQERQKQAKDLQEKQELEQEIKEIERDLEALVQTLTQLDQEEKHLLDLIQTHILEAQKQDRTQQREQAAAQSEQAMIQMFQSAIQALQAALASAKAATPFSSGLVAALTAAIQMYQQKQNASKDRKSNHEKNAKTAGQKSVAEKQKLADLKSSLAVNRASKSAVAAKIQQNRATVKR